MIKYCEKGGGVFCCRKTKVESREEGLAQPYLCAWIAIIPTAFLQHFTLRIILLLSLSFSYSLSPFLAALAALYLTLFSTSLFFFTQPQVARLQQCPLQFLPFIWLSFLLKLSFFFVNLPFAIILCLTDLLAHI